MSLLADACIPANPDISGIGVRIAIYVQNLLSFVPALSALQDGKVTPVELESLETQSVTILITAFAILLSVIIQAFHGGLTNYHAAIILNLSWMNNTNLFIYLILRTYKTLELYSQEKKKYGNPRAFWLPEAKKMLKNGVLFIGSAHLSLMAAVGIWLWKQPATFGNSRPCSLSASIIVGGQRALIGSPGLRIWSLLIYSLLLMPGFNLILPIAFFAAPGWFYGRYLGTSLNHKAGILLTRTGLAILALINVILLVDTEITIVQNRDLKAIGDAEWTFGQTLALLLLLVPFRDVVEALFERRAKKLGVKLLNASRNGQLDIVRDVINSGASSTAILPGLKCAVENHRWRVVEYLIQKGAKMSTIDSLLMIAAESGDLEGTKLLIEKGANKDAENSHGRKPIHLAAENLHLDVVKFLLEVDESDSRQYNAIYFAAQKGDRDVLKLLIKQGVDINEKGATSGETALHEAAKQGHIDITRILIDHKADMNIGSGNSENPGFTALHLATQSGYNEVVEVLLKRGATIDEKCQKGQTALHVAAKNGHTEIVQLMRKFGSDVNVKDNDGKTALYVAGEKGHIEVVDLLVELGATVTTRDNSGATPLHIAAQSGHLEVVKSLAGHGADVNARNELGQVALHHATENGHLEVVKVLAEFDDNSKISSHYAAEKGYTDILKFLVDHGENVDRVDEYGFTPLLYAVKHQQKEAIKVLIQLGANVNHSTEWNDHFTALHCAAVVGDPEVVRLLVESGADMNATMNQYGSVPHNLTEQYGSEVSHPAAMNGYIEVAKVLTELKPELGVVANPSGWTPLHYVISVLSMYQMNHFVWRARGRLNVVDYLVEHGAK